MARAYVVIDSNAMIVGVFASHAMAQIAAVAHPNECRISDEPVLDVVAIKVRYAGSSVLDTKLIARHSAHAYEVGSNWSTNDGSTNYEVAENRYASA